MLEEYDCILTPEEVSEILRIGMNRTYTLLNQNQIKASAKDVFGKFLKFQLLNISHKEETLHLAAPSSCQNMNL